MKNAASESYLTPFEAEGMKKSKKPKPGQEVHVTDYSSMIDPILEKRNSDFASFTGPYKDRFEYLLKNKEELMDQYERGEYAKEVEDESHERGLIKIAKQLCQTSNDLKTIKIFEFRKYMENDVILEHCARKLLQSEVKGAKPVRPEKIEELMGLFKSPIDKYLFKMFRDKQITLDQLKARISEKLLGTSYVVLDDLREKLHPSILNRPVSQGTNPRAEAFKIYQTKSHTRDGKLTVTVDELVHTEFQAWQTNQHCLRSIYHDSEKLKD